MGCSSKPIESAAGIGPAADYVLFSRFTADMYEVDFRFSVQVNIEIIVVVTPDRKPGTSFSEALTVNTEDALLGVNFDGLEFMRNEDFSHVSHHLSYPVYWTYDVLRYFLQGNLKNFADCIDDFRRTRLARKNLVEIGTVEIQTSFLRNPTDKPFLGSVNIDKFLLYGFAKITNRQNLTSISENSIDIYGIR